MTLQAKNDATRRFLGHSSLLLSNKYFMAIVHYSDFIRFLLWSRNVVFNTPFESYVRFSIVHKGGMSILAARERSGQEMMSPFSRAIMVFY
jgi:hypothetical protein